MDREPGGGICLLRENQGELETRRTGIETGVTERKAFSFVPGCPDTFLDAAGEYSGQFQRQTQSQCIDDQQVHDQIQATEKDTLGPLIRYKH